MQTCGEAGITARPRTAGGRDAMLRAAAEAAVEAAMDQPGAQLGGMPPAAFITGLAGDLGARLMPWTRRTPCANTASHGWPCQAGPLGDCSLPASYAQWSGG